MESSADDRSGMFAGSVDAAAGAEDVARPTWRDAVGAAVRLASHGQAIAGATAELAVEAAKIGIGRSAVAPPRGDWRFRNRAWTEHPAYRRLGQLYLAWSDTLTGLAEQTEIRDWHAAQRVRLLTANLTAMMAPTNFLLGNPDALERAFESGGVSLLRGLRNWTGDLRHRRGMPSQVDRRPFTVGGNLAATPGAVVFRNEACEVIEYRPTTASVRTRPVLVVPPPIGKFYFLDLAPGRSFFEYAVSRGVHMFTISWRNPGPQEADWDLDTYAGAVLEAVDAAREIAGADDVNAMGFCAGGIILCTVLNHLAAQGDARVHSASFAVTLLDFACPALIGAFSPRPLLSAARRRTSRAGMMSARDLAAFFAWLRPNDLVWNYWVNNYLLGQPPPAIDVMAWNADGTNVPAALHAQFLDMFQHNVLAEPGQLTVLGTPVDLASITCDAFFTGGINDHLTPWQGCYRSAQLLGGDKTFVLSNAGHIASLINPPTNPKARYVVGPPPGPDPDAWRAAATERTGTWWEYWADWLIERSGAERPAPAEPGTERYPVICAGPGTYVHG
jgi:polyhydroxyalkanoate synthase subunit PhaC